MLQANNLQLLTALVCHPKTNVVQSLKIADKSRKNRLLLQFDLGLCLRLLLKSF